MDVSENVNGKDDRDKEQDNYQFGGCISIFQTKTMTI